MMDKYLQLWQQLQRFSHLRNPILVTGIVLLLVVSTLLLHSCNVGNHKELERYIKEVQARPPGKLKPIPKFAPYHAVPYTALALRSPFQKSIKATASAAGPDVNRVKEPLEAFPLDSLRMVGTLTQGNKLWALVITHEGVIYRVTVGNHLGQNYGRIVSISQKKVDIQETILEDEQWVERPASLALVERSSKEQTTR